MPWKFIEDFEEFKSRMNCQFVRMRNGQFLFENGGISDGRTTHYDPPEDRGARLSTAHKYWSLRHAQAVKDVERISTYITTQTGYAGAGRGVRADPVAFESLQLATDVENEAAARVEQIEREMAELTGPHWTERVEADASRYKQEAREDLQRMREILNR